MPITSWSRSVASTCLFVISQRGAQQNVVISTTPVDLMGRLSNPPETLEYVTDQGAHGSLPALRPASADLNRSPRAM